MKDETGKKYNLLIALLPSHQDKKKQWHWLFKCECGNKKVINAVNVRNGNSRSCGCLSIGHSFSKETKEKMRQAKLGGKHTKEHIENMVESRKKSMEGKVHPLTGRPSKLKGKHFPHLQGEGSPTWKGEDVSYRNLHRWVVRKLGQPTECSECGKYGTGRQMHWANKSQLYKRIITDWARLCAKCHKAYDRNKLVLTSRQ